MNTPSSASTAGEVVGAEATGTLDDANPWSLEAGAGSLDELEELEELDCTTTDPTDGPAESLPQPATTSATTISTPRPAPLVRGILMGPDSVRALGVA